MDAAVTTINDSVERKACPVCGSAMVAGRPAWWLTCASCGMEASSLEPLFDERPMAEMFDWKQREQSLRDLRKANFERLLEKLETIVAPPARLLDVGCAEGWFLEAARARGYEVMGIEPDTRMSGQLGGTFEVRQDFFPDALAEGETFDIITFNDVFEHLPDVRKAIGACHRHLNDKGVVVFNLPNAQGGLYRISKLMKTLGVAGPFSRMWQEGYPSPHLSYFAPKQLRALAEGHGFEERLLAYLPAFESGGVWSRVRYDRTRSLFYSIIIWAGVMAALPLLRILPSDIFVQIFAKAKPPRSAGEGSST